MDSMRRSYNIWRNVLLLLPLVWIVCSYLPIGDSDSSCFLVSGVWSDQKHVILTHRAKCLTPSLIHLQTINQPSNGGAGERAQVLTSVQTSDEDPSSPRRSKRHRSLLKTSWNGSLHLRAEVYWRPDGAKLQWLHLNVTSDNLHASFLALKNILSVPAFTVEVNA